jgi:hypothetical protein
MQSRVLVFLVLAVVAGAGSVGVVNAQTVPETARTTGSGEVVGNPDLEVVVSENTVKPGEENIVEFHVLNEGRIRRSGPPEYVDRVTTARATTVEFTSRSDEIEVVTGRVAVGDVPPGESGPFRVRLEVDDAISSGTHQLSARVEYDYTRVVEYGETSRMSDLSRDERQRVNIRVREVARFDVSATTDARVGEKGGATVTVRNRGGDAARNATLTATSSDGSLAFDGAPNVSADVGDIPSGATVNAELPVVFSPDTNVRAHSIDVRIGYEDRRGVERVGDGSASVVPEPEQRFEVRDVEARLRAGGVGRVSGELVNLGGDVEDVVLRDVGDVFDVRGGGTAVGGMAENETVEFAVRVKSPIGTVSKGDFVLEPTYTTDGERYSADELRLAVPVNETRDGFDVSAVEGGTEVMTGGETNVVFEVANRLDEDARNVSVVAESGEPVEIEYGEAFVGTVASNTSKDVVFGVDADSDATVRAYPVTFTVRYTDTTGETLTTASVARLNVVEDEGAVPFENTVLIGVVVVLLLGLGWWVYGKEFVG